MTPSRSEDTPNPPSRINPQYLMTPQQREALSGARATASSPHMLHTLLPAPRIATPRPSSNTSPSDSAMTPARPFSSPFPDFTFEDPIFTPQRPETMATFVTGPAGNTPFPQRTRRGREDQTSPRQRSELKRRGEVGSDAVAVTAAERASRDASYIAEGAALLSTLTEDEFSYERDPNLPKPEVLLYGPGPHTGLSLEETELEYPVFYYDNATAFKRWYRGDGDLRIVPHEQAREEGETWEEKLRRTNRETFMHMPGNRSRSTSQTQKFVAESVERGFQESYQDGVLGDQGYEARQTNRSDGQNEGQTFVQHQNQSFDLGDGQDQQLHSGAPAGPRPALTKSVRKLLQERVSADPVLEGLVNAVSSGQGTPEEHELANRRLNALYRTLTQEQAASAYRAAEMARALEAQKVMLRTEDTEAKEQALRSRGFRSTPLRPTPELSREEMVRRYGERATAAHILTKTARLAGAASAQEAAQELERLTRGAPSTEDALYRRRPGRGSVRVGSLPEGFASMPARRMPRSEVVDTPVEPAASLQQCSAFYPAMGGGLGALAQGVGMRRRRGISDRGHGYDHEDVEEEVSPEQIAEWENQMRLNVQNHEWWSE
ncbi:hypothetical protein BU16DRAFT_610325 [Lophium mytilinum]|uniref:Uncharacterized protein n=1 Tax=Lophium mytilinum TaxID=390894 RepID=A0A6A6QTB2_9PEZI|nr:hypothetical protein BU16DRAFT_610325 [Lophium mytilinum]